MNMNTWLYGTKDLKKFTLTEILIVPDVPIHNIMINLGNQFTTCIYIDTIGNLSIHNKHNNLNLRIYHITSFRKFYRILISLQKKINFTLFIDSITFLSDKNISIYNLIYSLLWSLIYKNKCTIIVSNHYRYIRETNRIMFVPRLGMVWNDQVTYKIWYKYKYNKVVYDIQEGETITNSE